ncbi:MAG: helix-turn-helix transcriptional regulator [Nonomuraea sp.]|uniref:ArsR/SmtB family transcription factor n=1 Tax=Hamadaea sp. TaxID=2024425 RepID=UPI00180A58C1|nr:helix-turn-helix domain-containing protein [Hamadaea sp.]NUP78757.1 helix-turn-helix transcriptional regulator [Nonomuraea sp.]NUR70961.1 helix-turn-helix transcriptional regulator [Hamadaea sp.]NUT20072.1 helix-turn-helix transcriptional regulator [Hamadaea sp.]
MTEESRIHLSAHTLKGIAHPIRVRLLGLLRMEGPSTATKLAERIGQSSGVTSYHLRQLAQYGFVQEDASLGTGRERWWRASHQSTTLEAPAAREAPLETEIYMRAVATASAERVDRWLGEATSIPPEWDDSMGLNDYGLLLTPAEAAELSAKLLELLKSARPHYEKPGPPGAEQVVVQLNILPFLNHDSLDRRDAGEAPDSRDARDSRDASEEN